MICGSFDRDIWLFGCGSENRADALRDRQRDEKNIFIHNQSLYFT